MAAAANVTVEAVDVQDVRAGSVVVASTVFFWAKPAAGAVHAFVSRLELSPESLFTHSAFSGLGNVSCTNVTVTRVVAPAPALFPPPPPPTQSPTAATDPPTRCATSERTPVSKMQAHNVCFIL